VKIRACIMINRDRKSEHLFGNPSLLLENLSNFLKKTKRENPSMYMEIIIYFNNDKYR